MELARGTRGTLDVGKRAHQLVADLVEHRARPQGNDRFSVGTEPVNSGLRFDFNAYWMRMRGSGGTFWGNNLIMDESLQAPLQWTCVEVMIKLSDPVDSYNGELALWINGNQIAHLGPTSRRRECRDESGGLRGDTTRHIRR